MIQTFDVPLGGRVVNASGNFVRYETAGAEGPNQALKIRVDGQDLGSYLPGDAIELPSAGTVWEFVTAQASAVVKIGLGRITTVRSSVVGTISTSVRGVALANSQKTVTNAVGGVALFAANASRSYIAIQNKDPAGAIWVTFGGGAATQANGLRIAPGGFWEWDGSGAVPTGSATAIGDIASNANVLVLEG